VVALVVVVLVAAACGDGGGNDFKPTGGQQAGGGWQLTTSGWTYQGADLPACPDPLQVSAPVDVHLATSILYPGQTRGEYKPHGGFRLDGKPNEVQVHVPLAGSIVRGARLLVEGHLQSGFDVITPCGIMVRLGHLATLAPRIQARFEELPGPTEGDSRTTNFSPPIAVDAGDLVATAIGLPGNTFLDFGVYDLRRPNAKATDAAWASTHDAELAQHAVCWLDLLPAGDRELVEALPPGDPTAGRASDYC
jgi:hypothetical protein